MAGLPTLATRISKHGKMVSAQNVLHLAEQLVPTVLGVRAMPPDHLSLACVGRGPHPISNIVQIALARHNLLQVLIFNINNNYNNSWTKNTTPSSQDISN